MVLPISNVVFSTIAALLPLRQVDTILAAGADAGIINLDSISLLLVILVVFGGVLLVVFLRRRAASNEPENSKADSVLRLSGNERSAGEERRRSDREGKTDRRESGIIGQNAGRRHEDAAERATIDHLPISLFNGLAALPNVEPLPVSDDESLMAAIEEANDEIEADVEIRAMALKILVKFCAANAVEALSRMATSDPSTHLRAKATGALAEYDHESVFPAIVLAGADQTREVRAAAAKALFSLNFDRAHCWARLAEMRDDPKSLQIARAAIESGLAARSLERLVHTDVRAAYEAYAMMVLLIRSGEIDPIIEAIGHGRDYQIKLAMLHVLSIERNEACISKLRELEDRTSIPWVIRDRIRSLNAVGEGIKI